MVAKTKKLKTATSMEALPEEIIHVIFLRLPIKSLLKCTAVCKTWNSIISTSSFIDTHLHLNCRDGQLLLLQAFSSPANRREPFSLHRDNPSFDEYTKLRNPFLAYDRTQAAISKKRSIALGSEPINVVGTCNGLVCLVARDFTVLIWNPSIRKFVVLARPSVTFITDDNPRINYAFGYDSSTNDYKVLRTVSYVQGARSCEVEIWSLARGSWKSLTASIVIPGDDPCYPKAFLRGTHAFVNGALHWFHQYKMINYHDSIVSFDISSESFGEMTMPAFWGNRVICLISRYRDSLAFFEQEFTSVFRLSMWVMEEYGVANSCTNIFTMDFHHITYPYPRPLWFRNSGHVVLECLQGVLKSVDSKTKSTTDFRINEYVSYDFMDYFVESLVLLDKPNAISY
ncbi:hypothetical protein ABKV19_017994 [Rosa sericea]